MYYETAGEGEPLVLVSGTSSDHTGWALHAPSYQAEFSVIAFDNRGVGQSDKPAEADAYSVAGMAEDTVALLDELGIERAHFSGRSLGSAICQEVAINHPRRVLSAQLHVTWGRTDRWLQSVFDSMRAPLLHGDLATYGAGGLAWTMSPGFVNDEEKLSAAMALRRGHPHPPTIESLLGQLHADVQHDTLDRLESIQAPTLITAGELDWLLPERYGREVAKRISGAQFHLFTGPHSSHLNAVEDPEEFLRVTLEFLRRQKGRS